MNSQAVFGLQFILSLVAWAAIAQSLIIPWLKTKPPSEVLIWLTLALAFRHIGMVFLIFGALLIDRKSVGSFRVQVVDAR